MAVMLAVGALGLYSSAHTRQMVTDVSLRDSEAQNGFVQVRLLMETSRSQILQALQHSPGLDWAKLHDHGLVAVVGSVRQSSDSIATGSSQIDTGNADLSHRTEEQASNLQPTAASMASPRITALRREGWQDRRRSTRHDGPAGDIRRH
jgi:hypothetical protein